MRNPVVEKILNQMINVVNFVVDAYGKPDEIRIELARELKKSSKERKEMTMAINKTTADHEKYRQILQKEFGLTNVTRNDIIRYKLYLELKVMGIKLFILILIYLRKNFLVKSLILNILFLRPSYLMTLSRIRHLKVGELILKRVI